jgi:rRNA methylases
MGTTFHVPVYYAESWEGCLDALEKWGVSPTTSRGERVYAATMWMDDEEESGGDGNDDDENNNGASGKMAAFSSKPHFEVDWCGGGNSNRGSAAAAAALVLGKEGPGLSLQVRESVAKGEIRSVYVPMEAGIESLNVGTCGSVIMFEYYRQKLCTSRSLGGDDVNAGQ